MILALLLATKIMAKNKRCFKGFRKSELHNFTPQKKLSSYLKNKILALFNVLFDKIN